MFEKTKTQIIQAMRSIEGIIKIDLALETLSISDYMWLFEQISKSSHVDELVLPVISKEDADAVLRIIDEALIKNNILCKMNISIEEYEEPYSISIDFYLERIKSRLERNSRKIFGIHGGGNIGLGLMADIISKSGLNYRIRATTDNQLRATIINAHQKVWLRHDIGDTHLLTNVSHVEMVPRHRESVSQLYEEACLLAICVTPNIIHVIAEDAAIGLINRYKKDGSGLKILILMNIPNCADVARDAIVSRLKDIVQDDIQVNNILAGVDFVPTVIDRIVTPFSDSEITSALTDQLSKIDSRELFFYLNETNVASILAEPNLLTKAIIIFNLQIALFKAEKSFSMYSPKSFVDAKRFRHIRMISDLKTIEELKNKFINGPHAIMAWLGALKGYKTIGEAINDEKIYSFVKDMMQLEIRPILMAAYPQISLDDFDGLESDFIERCKAIEDPTARVARDPMRKLNKGGRIRGTLELAQERNLDVTTSRLQIGIAAAILYSINDLDPENPGCSKIKELFQNSGESFVKVLTYQGEAPCGIFTGLDPDSDKDLLKNIAAILANLHDGLIDLDQLLAEPFRITDASKLSIKPIATGAVSSIYDTKRKKNFKPRLLKKGDQAMGSRNVTEQLLSLGIILDESGHLFYADNFEALKLSFKLVFVRHGETFGNCGQSTADGKIDLALVESGEKTHEKRIFQGNVDTEINQLTQDGIDQAKKVAAELKTDFIDKGWEPDVILHSPLKRARDTALPFIEAQNFENLFKQHDGIVEMSFGKHLENIRVCDLSPDDTCHSFYREQHALYKSDALEAESFAEVLLRAYNVLMELENKYAGKNILMFSHSMFGAACCILLGRGKCIEDGDYLAFDGKRKDGTYYTMPNATPLNLNFELPRAALKKAL